jgi:methylglyoxal synthase
MNPDIQKEAPGIALVAHDACKQGMLEWARFNRDTLSSYALYTTGTTGALLARKLDLKVKRLAEWSLWR